MKTNCLLPIPLLHTEKIPAPYKSLPAQACHFLLGTDGEPGNTGLSSFVLPVLYQLPATFQVSHNPAPEEPTLVGFVLNLKPPVIKTSPKRSTQHFPGNSGRKSV